MLQTGWMEAVAKAELGLPQLRNRLVTRSSRTAAHVEDAAQVVLVRQQLGGVHPERGQRGGEGGVLCVHVNERKTLVTNSIVPVVLTGMSNAT